MLRGEKVILRAPSRADLPTFVRWFNDPEVTQYLATNMWPMSIAFNPRGIRCYQKCGFREEGRLRQHVFRHGTWHDEIVMGILRSEFQDGH